MTSHSASVLVVDVGGVLVDWSPLYGFAQELVEDATRMSYFLDAVCGSSWLHKLNLGRTWREAVMDVEASAPTYADLARLYPDRWSTMFRGQIDGSVDLIASYLAQGRRVIAFSNAPKGSRELILHNCPIIASFDGLMISGELGIAKPDLAAFRLISDTFDFSWDDALLIDDTAANVASARSMGISAVSLR